MQRAGTSVLIVDDEPGICSLIRDELAADGFDCATARDPARAQELLNSRPFDLLITDVIMPKISGLDLLAYVKRRMPDCKVVLITGQSKRECLAQAIMLGAYDYVEKPFDMAELLDVAHAATNGEANTPRLPQRAAAAMQLSFQTERASLESVRALVRAVEAKDPYTRRHSEQVTHYAVNLAGVLRLGQNAVESIRVAALLHDVGKIGVPDNILIKPGPLSEHEFELIRRHPVLGADILANITLFGPEAQLVRHHHERWDGRGYPDGLTGEESPRAARIIHVADAIDAMLMDRTYKRGYSVERVLDELARCAGTQFDPAIAAAAIRWCQDNPDKLVLPNRPVVLVR